MDSIFQNLPEEQFNIEIRKKLTELGLKLGPLLGEGGYGKVFLLTRKSDNKKFALKMMEKDKFLYDEYDPVFTELSIYYKFKKKYPGPDDCNRAGLLCSQNKMFNLKYDNKTDFVFVVIDYYDDITLNELLLKNTLNLYEKELIIYNLSVNLKLLHDLNMSHKDIKPENIRVKSKSPNKESTIIDYGISCYKELKDFKICRKQPYGTIPYMSPEVFYESFIFGNNLPEKLEKKYNDDLYSKIIDLWALGLTFYNILSQNYDIKLVSIIEGYKDIKDTSERKSILNKWKDESGDGIRLLNEFFLTLIDNPSYKDTFFSKIFKSKKLKSKNMLLSINKSRYSLNNARLEKIFKSFDEEVKKYNLDALLCLSAEGRNIDIFRISRGEWLEGMLENTTDTTYSGLPDDQKENLKILIARYRDDYKDIPEEIKTESNKLTSILSKTTYKDQGIKFSILNTLRNLFKNKHIKRSDKVNIEKINEWVEINLEAQEEKSIESSRRNNELDTSYDIDLDSSYDIDLTNLRNNPPDYPPPTLPGYKRSTQKSTLPPPPSRPAPKRTKKVSLSQTGTNTYSQTSSKTKKSIPPPPSLPPPKSSSNPRPRPRPRPAHTFKNNTFGKGKKKTKKNILKKSVSQKKKQKKKKKKQKKK